MTAPTEAEIRAEVVEDGAEWPKGDPYREQLEALVGEWANSLRSAAFNALEAEDPRDADSGAIWRDLRPSEAVVLRSAVGDAVKRATKRCEAIIVDELTAAGVQFAAEYPDAPRATREAVPA